MIDYELKALRVTIQTMLGTQTSGSIVALWPDGKIAANELAFIIDVVREIAGRELIQETYFKTSELSR